jgi:Domain of unknown function (DUF4349)
MVRARRHNGMLNKRGSRRSRRTRHATVAGLILGGTVLGGTMFLAGCSGNSSSAVSSPAQAPVPSAAAGAATELVPARAAAGAQGGNGVTTVRLAPAADIVYTAQLTLRAGNVNSAAAEATQIADGVGGYVSSETTSANPDHPSQATANVQLKIPVTAYSATLSRLAQTLGTQLSLQQQAQDVTEQVADVNSQVDSDQAAIAQLRALLSHAGSVSQLLSVQNQINVEEANLESMLAQQRALSHETTYATVTVTILGPKAKAPVHHPKAPPSLTGGFGAGWHALRVTVSWTLAFLGAVAPFAAVVAVAAYVVYRGRRWVLRRRPAAHTPSPES